MKLRNKRYYILFCLLVLAMDSCDVLSPTPVDQLTNDIVLNEPRDVGNVEIGLYSAFRNITPVTVIAGDFTADMLVHNGTFSQYRELGTKQLSSANASVAAMWGTIYNTVYIANFIIERLPSVQGVSSAQRDKVMGTAYFLRGYAYFIAAYTFGGVPEVLTTDIEANRNIARESKETILSLVRQDFDGALPLVPETAINAGYVTRDVVVSALAKLSLYQSQWADAETYATQVINSGKYLLEQEFSSVVTQDFPSEAIFEMGYTLADDPGTSGNFGLNNLFVGRREIIPSNQVVLALSSSESGDRFSSINFNPSNLSGSDNGWSVAKYGTADADNNNVMVFRLAELYLIRAEARAQLDKVTGENSAQSDINVLRTRAHGVSVNPVSKSQMLRVVEDERRYELAFEGHRWFDLVRTGRAATVMPTFSSNWRSDFEVWPIPQREIQNNPALVGNQNPGY